SGVSGCPVACSGPQLRYIDEGTSRSLSTRRVATCVAAGVCAMLGGTAPISNRITPHVWPSANCHLGRDIRHPPFTAFAAHTGSSATDRSADMLTTAEGAVKFFSFFVFPDASSDGRHSLGR